MWKKIREKDAADIVINRWQERDLIRLVLMKYWIDKFLTVEICFKKSSPTFSNT